MTAVTLAEDYASLLRMQAERVKGLGPDRRDPECFYLQRDQIEQDLRAIAARVELDTVFAKLPGHPPSDRPARRTEPGIIVGRNGRPVTVEVRRRRRTAA